MTLNAKKPGTRPGFPIMGAETGKQHPGDATSLCPGRQAAGEAVSSDRAPA